MVSKENKRSTGEIMIDKDFYKKQINRCIKDISKFKWKDKEQDYRTLWGYCNLIIANIKEILKEQK